MNYPNVDSTVTRPPDSSSPPLGALGKELADVQQRGLIFGMVIGAVVGLAGPLLVLQSVPTNAEGPEQVLGWLWFAAAVSIASFVAAAAIFAFVSPFLVSSSDRTAAAAHAWIGAREIRRLLGSASRAIGIPTTPEAAGQWLATQPDSERMRPLRVEMLIMTRRFEEARATIQRLPRATALDEYRLEEALALADDQETGEVDLGETRAALARIPRGIDRVEATASLAVFEARRQVGSDDWRAPLIAVRSQIPGSDWVILTRDFGLPIFQILAPRVVLPFVVLILLIAVAITVMVIT